VPFTTREAMRAPAAEEAVDRRVSMKQTEGKGRGRLKEEERRLIDLMITADSELVNHHLSTWWAGGEGVSEVTVTVQSISQCKTVQAVPAARATMVARFPSDLRSPALARSRNLDLPVSCIFSCTGLRELCLTCCTNTGDSKNYEIRATSVALRTKSTRLCFCLGWQFRSWQTTSLTIQTLTIRA
jgi:hypothetical protein